MKKSSFALFLVIVFISVFQAACGNGIPEEENAWTDTDADMEVLPAIPDDLTGGRPWMDACVEGNVTADTVTSPAEDFYIYANKEWIVSSSIPEGSYSLDLDIFAEARARVQAVLEGGDLSGHDARQAQLLFRAFCNTEAREALGRGPARQVIEEIRSLSSIDEVSDFLLDDCLPHARDFR